MLNLLTQEGRGCHSSMPQVQAALRLKRVFSVDTHAESTCKHHVHAYTAATQITHTGSTHSFILLPFLGDRGL